MMHSTKGRLKELKARLIGRSGQREFTDNCIALTAEIERLEKLLAA